MKKADFAEMKLNEYNEELTAANEELEEYVQQLAASEEELRIQYEQIAENEKRLIISEEKYRILINEMKQGVALYEGSYEEEDAINYRLLDANESHGKLMGKETKDIVGKKLIQCFPTIEAKVFEICNKVVKTGESQSYINYFKDTNMYYEAVAYRPKKLQLEIIVNDIASRKIMEYKLEYLSYHDQLTGLPNRRFLEEELMRLGNDQSLPLSVIMADVNELKLVNDSFGRSVGDKLLKKVVLIKPEY